jgi:hypothetical protein
MRQKASILALMLLTACGNTASGSEVATSPETPMPSVSSSAGEPAWDLAAKATMLRDPAGDLYPDPAGYLDSRAYGVVRGMLEGEATFAFPFAVDQPIPTAFEVPLGYDAAQYSYCLDTDKTKSPGGYPFATDEPVWCDYLLAAQSTGGATWNATLIDRLPLLEGHDAKVVDIPFFIDDTRKQGVFTVPASLLGDPKAFEWAMSVSLVSLPFPNDDFMDLDENYNRMKSFER